VELPPECPVIHPFAGRFCQPGEALQDEIIARTGHPAFQPSSRV
jgi:hypothetical protein